MRPTVVEMLVKGTRAAVLLLMASRMWSVAAQSDVNEVRLIFPHVVSGEGGGLDFVTILVFSNPGPALASVTLTSDQNLGLEEISFDLKSSEGRLVEVSGGRLRAGLVDVKSSGPLAANALLRAQRGLEEPVIAAMVPGSPLVSKAVVPILVNSPYAENTGLAIFYRHGGSTSLRFTLFDLDGAEVATRMVKTTFDPDRAAFFINELFDDLPPDFRYGSLVVEQAINSEIPDSFALTALYTQGPEYWSAEVTPVDDVRGFTVFPVAVDEIQSVADYIAMTYGAEVHLIVNDFIKIYSTKEVARAISRDPAIRRVEGAVPITPP